MRETPRRKRLLLGVIIFFIGLHVLLIWSLRILPFTDLPVHLAAATIVRHYGEPTNQFAEFYRLDASLSPNVAHLLFCSAKFFPSVEFANKVFFTVYLILFPLSMLLVIGRAGGNPWFVLLCFPLLYNFSVSWGFVGFAMATPFVLLLLFYLLDEQFERRVAPRVIVLLLLLALFFTHVLAALFGFLVVAAISLHRHRRSPKDVLAALLPVLPLLALIALWWIPKSRYQETGTLAFLVDYYRGAYFKTLYQRSAILFRENFHLFDGLLGFVVALCFSLVIILPVLPARRSGWKGALCGERERPKTVAVFFICSLFCALALPDDLPGHWAIQQRFSLFVMIGLILLGSILHGEKIGPFGRIALCVVSLVHFILWADYFKTYDRESYGAMRKVMPRYEKDKRLAYFPIDVYYRGQKMCLHMGSYYTVWEKGIAVNSTTDARFGMVRRKVGFDRLPAGVGREWMDKNREGFGRYGDMEYLLLRADLPEEYTERIRHFKRIRGEGIWALYENEMVQE